jgi:chemosensory pili system protein ChpA (sensor histidine kinase/response regulator)
MRQPNASLPLRRRGLRHLRDLGLLVGVATAKATTAQVPLLLVRSGDQRAAVASTRCVGNREIVVKSGGPQLAVGAGHLRRHHHGRRPVVVILDIAPLVRQGRRQTIIAARTRALCRAPVMVERAPGAAGHGGRRLDHDAQGHRPRARTQQFEVATAKDGIDALENGWPDASRT